MLAGSMHNDKKMQGRSVGGKHGLLALLDSAKESKALTSLACWVVSLARKLGC